MNDRAEIDIVAAAKSVVRGSKQVKQAFVRILFAAIVALLAGPVHAEDGYNLWLRYQRAEPARAAAYERQVAAIAAPGNSATMAAARQELVRGFTSMLGRAPAITSGVERNGSVLLGTPGNSAEIRALALPVGQLGPEGYLIRSMAVNGKRATVIAANTDVGALYGAFHLLRLAQTAQSLDALNVVEKPATQLRVLNHWDNLSRDVERGYAGQSLWDWQKLPRFRDPRYIDYARANASIGINGTVLNNVNAQAEVLRSDYLAKVKALAEVFRPYGIKVYLSVRFSAPVQLGGLKTADPLDPAVQTWWRAKADEIYREIPDFGGFLVKANSEGQPGPQDYKRTHADGANMLAEAVKPHGGVIMWRAFVYAAESKDRVKQAYEEFKPLDGKFADNVIIQVKNGPLDFQPREPFSPLFGAMPKTPLMMEVQLTKEYLGFATHLAYLGTMWEEVLQTDTHIAGPGSTVASVVDGTLHGHRLTGMAGVANIGTDRNWTGSQFDQANWYAFGRLAWNPRGSARSIAQEWTRSSWGNGGRLVQGIVPMMMQSRSAVAKYMTPLGLTHVMDTGHHYGPGPWVNNLERPDWNPTYYHKADQRGIGFDRTATGSNALSQYARPVAARFGNLATVPDDYLLWFHRASWDYRVKSGRTVWDQLVTDYGEGVRQVGTFQQSWAQLAPFVDQQRHAEVATFLQIQREEAQWWRDASIAYFQSISKRPLPAGAAPPPRPLEYYKSLTFPYAPGN